MMILKNRPEADRAADAAGLIGEYELPSFSGPVMNVLNLLRRPEVEIQVIAEELQKDPGLSVQALRLVNSVGYGLTTRVSNVQHAVVLMGRSRLECLVLTVAVKTALPGADLPGFDLEQFWRTAALRATLAGGLARELHRATEVESFTAALLQDIGVALLAERERERYIPLYRQWLEESEGPLSALERSMFGFDHAEIGGELGQHWGLPPFLVDAIRLHHTESETCDAAIRLVADLKTPIPGPELEAVGAEAKSGFGLHDDQLAGIVEKALQEADTFYQALDG